MEDNLRAGRAPEEARRQALIKPGGVTLTQELYREQGGLPMLETLFQGLCYGIRMMRKHKGFTPVPKFAQLRIVLTLVELLQRKNTSIKKLGASSDCRISRHFSCRGDDCIVRAPD